MTVRDPDQIFRGSFAEPTFFEDLTERSALKLTSILRFAGRPHFTLWQDAIGLGRFREEAGQYTPVFFLEIEVVDRPIEPGATLAVDVEIRLARERGVAPGREPRLVSEGRTRVRLAKEGGEAIARTRKVGIFAHLDASRGRVTRLHPMLGMGDHPRREIDLPSAAELLAAPPGFQGGDDWTWSDREAQVWSYQQTDPNRHVHAMEYPRMMELFAVQELARAGHAPTAYVFSQARIFFARPCYTGEAYRRRARLWRGPRGEEIVCAAIYKAGADGRVAEGDRPATIAWLYPRRRDAAASARLAEGEAW